MLEKIHFIFLLLVSLIGGGCNAAESVINVTTAGALEQALASAHKDNEIYMAAGVYNLKNSLTIVSRNLKLIGAGKDKTVLDFTAAKVAGQGVLILADGVRLDGFSVKNTVGDGVVSRGASDVTFHKIKVSWDLGVTAGGYGIYPVLGRRINIIDSESYGATEAGIYVGQTYDALIENNTVKNNVIGIDVENSFKVVVKGNVVESNSIGITLSSRPNLTVTNPYSAKVMQNNIKNNNLQNFSPSSAFSSHLGSGAAIRIVAFNDVELSRNYYSGRHRVIYHISDYGSLGLRDSYQKDFVNTFFGIKLLDVIVPSNYSSLIAGKATKPSSVLLRVQEIYRAPIDVDKLCVSISIAENLAPPFANLLCEKN